MFNIVFIADNWFIHQHGAQKMMKTTDVLVTAQVVLEFGVDPKLRKISSMASLVDDVQDESC